MVLGSHQNTWRLHISRGRLLYAENEAHRLRRWDRALRQHCPQWKWRLESPQLSDHRYWEYQLLDLGIRQKQLSLIQAKLVIRTVVQECLFELGDQETPQFAWQSGSKEISPSCNLIALSLLETQPILTRVMVMYEKWKTFGLSYLNPSLSPILNSGIDPQTLPVSAKYLNANFTLWDLALILDQSLIEVTRSLVPFAEKHVLQFQKIPDLAISTLLQSIGAAEPFIVKTEPSLGTKPTHFHQKQPLPETKPTHFHQNQPLPETNADSHFS
ncbi:MAG: hypothetical protein HC764_24770, partial [Pleurocapsa sp. CRU_1_2]|nr:hypothetical protein [Pleurocapsa sp. CRU_1_2]